MRAFGGGGSRESACRRFRDAEGTRRGWNFGRCEPLVRQRDCLPTRVDASRLWPARRRRHRALVVRHRRPSLSFPRGETAPTVPRGGRFGRAPGSLMRRRLDAVSALASALCEALPRARLAELAGAPGRDVPASFGVVARSSFASRSGARARLGAAPAPTPARRFQRARAGPRVHWPAREDARRFQRAHDALRFARLASADDRARPAARARSSAIAGEGPALARRLLVDARASFAYRGEDGVVTRACAARAAQAWALVCELAASDASGWVPERDATSAELAGAGDILRALVDVDGDDDDVNDDAPVAARAACDSPPDAAFALAAFALPEAWSLAQLTLANADAGGGEVDDVKPPEGLDAGAGSHPRDVVERLSASPLPFAAWRRSARARFVHLPRVDAESRLYAFAARGDVGRGATHTIEDAGVGAGGGAGGGGNDRNSVGKEKLGRRDIPDGRDDLDAPSDASWAVAADILAAWGAVAAAGGGAPADETHARCVFRVAAACADELSSRGFSSRRGYSARRREGDGSNPPPGGRRSFEGLSADVSRLTSERVAALARASISAARQMARAYERDPDAASRALIPEAVRAAAGARAVEAQARGGRGRNRRRGGLAEADAPGTLAEADALGTLALAEAEATADALALWALVLDGGGRPYREAFLPTQTWWAPPPPAGVPRGGGPPKTKSNGSEAFSPNQPGFRAAVEALHREAGRGGDARLGLGDEASERRVRRRLDDVAATAWTSFLDRGMPIDRRDVRAVTGVARAHEGSLLGPEPPAGVRLRRARAPKRKRGSVPSRTTRWGGRRARWSSRRASSRGTRGREMSRRDVAAILGRPPGAPPPRRRPSRRRSRHCARRRRARRRRGVRRETVARRTAAGAGRRRGRTEAPPRRNRNRNRNRRRLKRRRRVVADPAWDPPRGGSRTSGGALRRRARSRGARDGLGGGRPRGDPRVERRRGGRRGRRGRGTSFRPRPRLRFRRRRRTRSRRRRRAFSRRASTASSFATRACGRGRGRRRPRRRRRLRSVTRRPRRSEIGPEKLFKVRRRFRRFARRSRTRRGA